MRSRAGADVVTAMRTLDPELPFKIGPMNGRQARESGLWLKLDCAQTGMRHLNLAGLNLAGLPKFYPLFVGEPAQLDEVVVLWRPL
jgi:hypothetical protein